MTALALCVRRAPAPTAPAGATVVRVRVPSSVEWVEQVVELLVRHCLAGHPTPDRTLFRLRVVAAEALANAIVCGNREDPAKWVEVRAELTAEAIRLHVGDEGEGFDPSAVPEPFGARLEGTCGRGIFLIRQFADDVSFNSRGNAICMTLHRR